MWIFKGKVVNSKNKQKQTYFFLFFFLFEKQRIDLSPDRHRHACCDDFDLQGLHLAKNRSVIFLLSISGQEINSGVGGFQGR